MTFSTIVFALIGAFTLALFTDYALFKWNKYREVEKSWKELNEKLEKTGRKRLDKK